MLALPRHRAALMRYVVLGLAAGLLAAFPQLAALAAVPAGAAVRWAASPPMIWALAASLAARPRLTRRHPRSTS